MDVIKTLNEFIEIALRNRKYASNSVYGYRAAIKLFDEELNEDERASLELFKSRFEQVFSNILNKKKNTFSISSLQVYRKRVHKVLGDYEKYGIDPSKMSSWNPVLKTAIKSKSSKDVSVVKSLEPVIVEETQSFGENSKHEYSLRNSKKIFISYPQDFTLEEAKSIKSFAEYLISMKSEDKS